MAVSDVEHAALSRMKFVARFLTTAAGMLPRTLGVTYAMTVSADSASEMAYQGIRKLLADGELVPGQRLSQSNLARRLCCSPMPVVEALRRLESEGLLVKQARKQARVRELSMEDLEGLSLLREAIESVTARLAAQRAATANASPAKSSHQWSLPCRHPATRQLSSVCPGAR